MGSLGDEDDGAKTPPIETSSNAGTSDSDAQFFDSQSWSPKFLGKEVKAGDDDVSSQSILLMDETEIFEEAFETQFLNLPGETQVMDFDCEAENLAWETQVMDFDGEAEDFAWETQVMDFNYEAENLAGETQVMDFGGEGEFENIGGDTQVLDDVNCTEHMETQVVDAFESAKASDADSEVSDRTGVLSNGVGIAKKSCNQFGDTQKVQCSLASEDDEKGLMEQPDASSDKNKNSESQPLRFTSVRAASLRASGLMARKNASKGNKNVLPSLPTSKQSAEKFDVTGSAASATEPGKEKKQEQALGRYDGRTNSSRNTNMCIGGTLTVRKLFGGNIENEKEELPYDTTIEFPSCDVAGLSYVGSQEPGDLSQANALDFVDRFIKESVAEFDKEADCGKGARGQSICRSSAKGPQELAKKVNKKGIAGELGIYDWDDSREDEGGGDIFYRRKEELLGCRSAGGSSSNPVVKGMQDGNDKRFDVFDSDSKLLSRKLKVTDKTVREGQRKSKRNLVNDLSSLPHIICQDKQLEENTTTMDVPEMFDVGIDTQIAAEAMEALFHGGDTANRDVSDACQDVKKASTACKSTKQPSSRKRAALHDVNLASRLSKRTRRVDAITDVISVSSEKQFRHVRNQSEGKIVTTKSNKAKGTARAKLDRRHMQEKVGHSEPVAHRTRRLVELIEHQTRQSSTASCLECDDNNHRNRGTRASKTLASDLNKEFQKVTVPSNAEANRGTQDSKSLASDLNKEFQKVAAPSNAKTNRGTRASKTLASDLNKEFQKVAAPSNAKTNRGTRASKTFASDLNIEFQKVAAPSNAETNRTTRASKTLASDLNKELQKVAAPSNAETNRTTRASKTLALDLDKEFQKVAAPSNAETNRGTRASKILASDLNKEFQRVAAPTNTEPNRGTRASKILASDLNNEFQKVAAPTNTEANRVTRASKVLASDLNKEFQMVAAPTNTDTNRLTRASKVLASDLNKEFQMVAAPTNTETSRVTRASKNFASDLNKEFQLVAAPTNTETNRATRASKVLASDLNKEFQMVAAPTNTKMIDALSCPQQRRSLRNLSWQVKKSDNIDDLVEPSVHPEAIQTRTSFRKTRSSVKHAFNKEASPQRLGKIVSDNAESVETSARFDESPQEKSKPLNSLCITPVNCKISISDTSPICMGDEYFKQSCERSSRGKSVFRELRSLRATAPLPISPAKDLRKRREITDVRVLYSHHLDDGVIKQQKKILARLGVSVASSMAEATHFIADQFVRTRNMLEAIASGKPVVTHIWLESCGQSNCFIDEKNYILRDAKKEKEFGFSMSASLACASRHPLLQGLRVLVTPNTKPGKETISTLVKAVEGQVVERIGRSVLKDGTFPDDLLVLSCEEDYTICVPFLEQGATIYSSELLLNGIVTQKLEYDRYRLFTDHVRRTRSTIWLKKDGTGFSPVAKSNKD